MGNKRLIPAAMLAALFLLAAPASAVDPATMTAAAPKALELASIWSPHTISALQSGGIGMMKMGEAAASIFLLPLGLAQCTLGAPLGMFDDGAVNCIKGGMAPFELVYQAVLLPIRFLSLGTIR